MQKKIFKKFKMILVWFCVWSLSLTALLGVNLSHAKADDPIDPTKPTVEFVKSNDSDLESTLNPLIQVTLDSVSINSVTVDCAIDTTNTTANIGDYSLLPSMTISADDTTGYLPLQITNNAKVDGDRTIVIDLESPSEATLGSQSEFTYTILDDDQPLTTLTTDISAGLNGWFPDFPEITLESNIANQPVKTYYQWNDEVDYSWYEYQSPFKATLERENTLYFRTLDSSDNILYQDSQVIKVLPIMTAVTATLTSENQVKLSWNAVTNIDHYEIYRGGIWLASLNASYTSFIDTDQQVTTNQNYQYKVIAVDIAGNRSLEQAASIFVPEPIIVTPPVITETESVTPPVIQHAISYGVSTYKPSVVTAEVKAAEAPVVTDTNNGENDGNGEESESSNWNKLLLAISILIIAAGAAVAGYYGYQWWTMQKNDDNGKSEDKKSDPKSRW